MAEPQLSVPSRPRLVLVGPLLGLQAGRELRASLDTTTATPEGANQRQAASAHGVTLHMAASNNSRRRQRTISSRSCSMRTLREVLR